MDWTQWFARRAGEHPRCPEYVGLSITEISELVAPHRLRIIDVDQIESSGGRYFLTADLRADRVNVLIQHGVVTAAATF